MAPAMALALVLAAHSFSPLLPTVSHPPYSESVVLPHMLPPYRGNQASWSLDQNRSSSLEEGVLAKAELLAAAA
jgi:hypothetical protein